MLNVYITNLAMYNEGTLYGKWVSLPMDEDELKEEIKSILRPGDEEYFITDYESEIGYEVGEYENIFTLNEQMERLEDTGEDEKIINALLDYLGDLESVITVLENRDFMVIPNVYDEEDVGYYLVDEGLFGVEIPDSLANYIDYEAIGRDWVCNGGVIYSDLGIGLEVY